MTREITNGGLKFLCDTDLEVWRAKTLFTKEPGTIRWLEQVQPGDVFYDVGANIGCYTLLAAQRGARVYAFEPHAANFASLKRNIAANNFHPQQVTALHMAISDYSDDGLFASTSDVAGSSGHQLGAGAAIRVRMLDDIVMVGGAAPDFVKIDIDGLESTVLLGMDEIFTAHPPRSLQVETSPTMRNNIIDWLGLHGYVLKERHRTMAGEKAVGGGADSDSITDNAVFERSAA